eukprot:gene12960-14290_t
MAQETQDKTCSFDLKQDQTGVWRCEGRVPGYNPIYISRHQLLATRIVEHYHRLTLHGEYKQRWQPYDRNIGFLDCDKW